jgi:hypothetical protein
MLTLFAREKEAVEPVEILDIEKKSSAQDEISRILRESRSEAWPETPNHRMTIFQRQF